MKSKQKKEITEREILLKRIEELESSNINKSVGIMILVIGIITILTIALASSQDSYNRLHNKYDNIYSNIHIERNLPTNLWYYVPSNNTWYILDQEYVDSVSVEDTLLVKIFNSNLENEFQEQQQ